LRQKAPSGVNFGNYAQNTGRPVNGEVSDYMFKKHGIIALSPELGNNDIMTNTYYISDRGTMKAMFADNYNWVKHAVQTLLPQFNVTLTSWSQKDTTWKA